MTRFPSIYLTLLGVVAILVTACNDDNEELYAYSDPLRNSVMVSAFNLQADDSILTNLDSVFFTIDLDHSLIFNADSLPKGTRVNRLIPVISLPALKKAEITMPSSTGADTVVNYLTNSTDSIDFSRGYVKLYLQSLNEEVECTYTIYVNVHKMNPDSLAWGDAAWATIPSAAPDGSKAVKIDDKVYIFAKSANGVSRSATDNLTGNIWATEQVTLPAGARLESLTACGSALYILDSDNALHTSADLGSTWSATGATMSHIYGVFSDKLIGVEPQSDGSYLHVTYPASVTSAVSRDCPVSGTSQTVTYTSEWSTEPMLILVGGRRADGSLTGDCWAFDGNEWAPSSITPMAAIEGAVMVPYFAYSQKSDWTLTKRSILLAMGGRKANGEVNSTVYISYDRGVHWSIAPTSMQLPADIPALYGASALVQSKLITSRAAYSGWNPLQLKPLAPWYVPMSTASSRASEPITEWDCPYIYIIGGHKADGTYSEQIYRAVINRLMFKPIQ